MDWLNRAWQTAKENSTWVGLGVLAVVGGGAAVYYVTTTREQAIRQEQQTLQLQLEQAGAPQAAEEEAVAAAPVSVRNLCLCMQALLLAARLHHPVSGCA